jgi:hypothetical protein
MEKLVNILSDFISKNESELMQDSINYLRINNIPIFDENGKYRGLEAILEDVANVEASKFEKS